VLFWGASLLKTGILAGLTGIDTTIHWHVVCCSLLELTESEETLLPGFRWIVKGIFHYLKQ